jgi:hypothetical protein
MGAHEARAVALIAPSTLEVSGLTRERTLTSLEVIIDGFSTEGSDELLSHSWSFNRHACDLSSKQQPQHFLRK